VGRVRRWDGRNGIVVVLLALMAVSAAVVSSCGEGGGGSSDGGLCEQCGDTDGPCRPSVSVSGSDATALCPAGQATCDVRLACLRELDSAQRRCFPQDSRFDQFECDGARANRHTATPTPSPTLRPTATRTVSATGITPSGGVTPTPTASPTPGCGNGEVDEDEECDGADLNDEDCETLCDVGGGTLRCTPFCTFDFSACEHPTTCSP
jgi:hypothetical protein